MAVVAESRLNAVAGMLNLILAMIASGLVLRTGYHSDEIVQ